MYDMFGASSIAWLVFFTLVVYSVPVIGIIWVFRTLTRIQRGQQEILLRLNAIERRTGAKP